MDASYFIGLAQHALWVLALVAVPVLIPALVAGVVLGMLQAATSINETTLSFIPKLIIVALCLAIFGGSMMALLIDFTREMFSRIPDMAR
jgi:flagellar biosynthetic protein FliQ